MFDNESENIIDFLSCFKDEETCRKTFEKIRFRNGQYCPHCGCTAIYRFNDGKRFRCKECKKDFTIITKTIFGESKIGLKKWFVAIYLLTTSKKGISSVQLAKQIGVTQKTAWFMEHRLRHTMEQNQQLLCEEVEVDETYVGGKGKNKHASKRVANTQGSSVKTKVPVFGMFQRNQETRAYVIGDVKMKTLEKKLLEKVKTGSHLFTDTLLSYSKLHKFYDHHTVNHGTGEYVKNKKVYTNSIESFWALFKRGFIGVYHSMSVKHLQKYVNEFIFRFNLRENRFTQVFAVLLEKCEDTEHLSYKGLTR